MSKGNASKYVKILAWCLLAPGLFSVALSLANAWSAFGLGMNTTEGVVTGTQTRTAENVQGHLRYREHAVVEFTTDDGRKIVFTDRLGGAPSPYERGETVRVRYDPDNPADARIAATSWLGLAMSSVMLLGGLGMCVVGLLLLLAARLPWTSSTPR